MHLFIVIFVIEGVYTGDSRTVHSLVVLLSNFDNVKLVYISPDGLEMPESIVQEVTQRNASIKQITTMTLEEAVKVSHVLYVTRIQRERFDNQVTGKRYRSLCIRSGGL